MLQEAIAGFVLGVLGSMHCVGMCGPLVMAIPFTSQKTIAKKTQAYFTYGASKTGAYMLIGLVVGMIGSGARELHWQSYLSLFAGGLLLIGVLLPMLTQNKTLRFPAFEKMKGWINSTIAQQFNSGNMHSFAVIGFLNGLLPCGMVYAAVAVAVSLSSIGASVGFMLFFGLATMLSLSIFSVFFLKLSAPLRMKLKNLFPYFMLITAILLILRGLELGIPYLSPILSTGGACGRSCCGS